MHDIRMPQIELAGCRVVTVALLGNGQRHDPCLGRSPSRLHLLALIAQDQNLANAADDAPTNPRRAFFHRGIDAVLRREPVANIRRSQTYSADAPGALIECED